MGKPRGPNYFHLKWISGSWLPRGGDECFGPWRISRSLPGRMEGTSQKKKNWEKRIRDEKVHGILRAACRWGWRGSMEQKKAESLAVAEGRF